MSYEVCMWNSELYGDTYWKIKEWLICGFILKVNNGLIKSNGSCNGLVLEHVFWREIKLLFRGGYRLRNIKLELWGIEW